MSSDWHHLTEFIQAHSGEPIALATLVSCEGSSYRKAGARLLVSQSSQHSGSLSGGCLEESIAKTALVVLADGKPRSERVDTQPHFGCPGVLTIQIEKIPPHGLLDEISNNISQRETFSLTTDSTKTILGESQNKDENESFTEVVTPPTRLLVIGWTSDQDPLFQMAQHLHWDCIRIVRDEQILAETTPVAHEDCLTCPPEELSHRFPPDAATAVLIMSHHLATDLAYLKSAAAANYCYLGLLGSRRRREKLLHELGESGLLEDSSWLANFHGPVGLDIGAQHPATIALSILAEIQAKLHPASPSK